MYGKAYLSVCLCVVVMMVNEAMSLFYLTRRRAPRRGGGRACARARARPQEPHATWRAAPHAVGTPRFSRYSTVKFRDESTVAQQRRAAGHIQTHAGQCRSLWPHATHLTRHTSQYSHRDKLEARCRIRCRNVTLGHVQAKDTEDAQRSAQKAIADMPVRSEVKLVTCAQPSEAGS